MRWRIGEALVRGGLISPDDLRLALAEHGQTGGHIGEVIVRMGFASEAQIATTLAQQLGYRHVDLVETPPDALTATLVPEHLARRHLCIGFSSERGELTIAMADPMLFGLVRELEVSTGLRVKQVVASASQIAGLLPGLYAGTTLAAPVAALTAGVSRPNPVIAGVGFADVFDLTLGRGATEVSIEQGDGDALVRQRVAGKLADVILMTAAGGARLIAEIKAAAGMPDERTPQQGQLRVEGTDYHVIITGSGGGEHLVIRAPDRE